jgi:polyisoprenyl-phosphate glycosyltransferase
MLTDKKISIVIICYNDGGSVREMYRRVTEVMQKITDNYEIVYVNEASPDDAYEHLSDLAARDKRLVVITHSRNFGGQNAYTSGLDYCTGEAAIMLDGDIQDPPEMFPQLVEKWLEGYDVVYGERVRREGSIVRRIGYKIFYKIFAKLSHVKMPLDASDFGLIDRKVIDTLGAMPESGRFIRGMRAWTGFKSIGLPYKRAERFSGETNLTFWDNVRWAKLAIFSFSYKPLELISYVAMLVTVLSASGIVFYIVLAIWFEPPAGFLTTLVIVLFLGSIQLLSLSIIGEYLWRIFDEVKDRPKYIRKEILNDYKGVMKKENENKDN